jgi:2-amino-4-hydroxy-6-hydroxymethyldihydropteridine diphosphokinase
VTSLVLIGLGANLGDPPAQLARGVELLAGLVEVERVSSLYRSEPVGHAGQPDFLNLAVTARAVLEPLPLLLGLHAIENALGRVRSFPNAPRSLDLDLLAYGDLVLDTRDLTLPHPRLHLRGFVLHPLAEVAPEWIHPVLGRTARELLSAGRFPERVERIGALRPFTPPLAPGGPQR